MTVPSDVAGLVLWLEADTIPGLSDGDPITTWSDDSGLGNDATGAGATRPIYRTNVLNGLPAARFDGADFLVVANDSSLQPQEYSAFAVGSYTGTAAGGFGNSFNYSAGVDSAFWGRGYGLGLGRNIVLAKKGSGDGTEEIVFGGRVFSGTVHTYYDGHYDGAEMTIYERGLLRDTLTPDTQGISYTNVLGIYVGVQLADIYKNYVIGDVCEIIVYDNYLSEADRTTIQNYLAEKWFPTLQRFPIAEDVDNETGARIYMTMWNNGALTVQRRSTTTLALETQYSFGLATALQVTSKTYYIVPYCPSFPGTARLGDIVYIFGRWADASTVHHVARSTDGGVSFTDIGDASWSSERVTAFSADDAGVSLWAFLDDRTLWYSGDSGATWAQINTTPFVVEQETVSRHGGSGRELLIGSSLPSALMAARQSEPYDGDWIGADGPPSLPGGDGLASIVWL